MFASPSCPGDERRHHRRLPRRITVPGCGWKFVCSAETRRRSIGALSRREAANCPRVRPVSSTSGTARPRCSIRPASCGRAQRPRRPRQVAASRGGPVGSGQSAAVRHQQQHEASPQHPAQWNVVHVAGSYGDCRHRHGRSARSPGRPDRRRGEAKRSLLRHRPAQGSCEPAALAGGPGDDHGAGWLL